MAFPIDINGVTVNPEEVKEFGQIILEAMVKNPSLRGTVSVETGIVTDTQILFSTRFGMTGLKKADGSCGRVSSGATVEVSEKFWSPVKVEDTLEICQEEIGKQFKAYYNNGTVQRYRDLFEIEGSDEAIFLATLFAESAIDAVNRLIWFADTNVQAADAVTAGLINGAQTIFFDHFDGFWTQIYAAVTAGDMSKVDISENATAATLPAGAANQYIEDMWDLLDVDIKTDPMVKIYLSGEMFNNYRRYLKSVGIDYETTVNMIMGSELMNQEFGVETLRFSGRTVLNMETVWDRYGKLFVNNTTDNYQFLKHRAIMTLEENLKVGTLNENDMTEVDTHYDWVTRINYLAYGFTLDAKVGKETEFVVAY